MKIIQWLNLKIFWGIPALIVLLGIGLYLFAGSGGAQLKKFGYILRSTISSIGKKSEDKGTVSQFAAICTSLATTVGMGNIVGVSSALCLGGPGAVFWMVVAGFLGMVMKFFEVCLTIMYREQTADGEYVGGPAFYIKKGANSKFFAVLMIVLICAAALIGNLLQSNVLVANVVSVLPEGVASTYVVGGILAVVTAIIVIGGIKRLAKICEVIVPIMTILYFLAGLVVVFINIKNVPPVLELIFKGAFTPVAVGGGVVGYGFVLAARYGVARGFFSNGGGQAMYCIPFAAAKVNHPVEQAKWAVTEVSVDLVVCITTALTILTSSVALDGANAAVLANKAFAQTWSLLEYPVALTAFLFTFTNVIGFCYVGESQLNLIFDRKWVKLYRWIYPVLTFVGAIGTLGIWWDMGDAVCGLIMMINLPVLVFLAPKVFKITKEYFADKNLKTA